jgi:hypothetical protein
MKEFVRAWLCRIGWDNACRNTPQEAQEGLERMEILSWRLKNVVAEIVEERRHAVNH